MREPALQVANRLRDRPYLVGGLAEAIEKSQSWISEVVSELENEHLARLNGDRVAGDYRST